MVSPGETIEIENDIRLTVVNAYNTEHGTSTKKQHTKGRGVGFILTLSGLTFYHLGDTDFLAEKESLRNIDVTFISIGGKFTMNIDEAIKTTLVINPKIVVPIHNLGQDFSEFASKLHTEGKNINESFQRLGK